MRIFKKISIFIAAAFVAFMFSSAAFAAPKANSVKITAPASSIDLAVSKMLMLSAEVFPEGASQSVTWTSSNKSIATVSASGLVTAKKTGKVTITVKPKGVNKPSKIQLTIEDSLSPASISVRSTNVKMKIGETYSIDAAVKPDTASQRVTYKSSNSAVASVSPTGEITAKKAGSAKVTIRSERNSKVAKTISVVVAKLPAPSKLILTPADAQLTVGEPLQLTAMPSPSNAASGVKWSSSDPKIAKVSTSGLITPLRPGKVKITATSTSKSSVKVARTFTVIDPYTLASITLNHGNLYLGTGDTQKLSYSFTPATAVYSVSWSSSNTSAVSVDSSGVITAKVPGSAVISVKSDNGKSSQITVAVIDRQVAIDEPERNTPVEKLNENLKKIDAIKSSALAEIEILKASGELTASSAARRKDAIENAFSMYRFPWMTDRAQNYWYTSASSKAFKPGVIYYGMPYIQRGTNGNDSNRRYTPERALSGGYFVSAGSYYKMNHSKKLNGTYVGSDCSSFVNMCIFGTNHAASYYRTGTMAASSYYKTVKGTMLPGDLLVKANDHTVMFLYYTNSAKTHMMIIEQGGGTEPNTIASRHKEVAKYTKGGYIIRRPVKYDQ